MLLSMGQLGQKITKCYFEIPHPASFCRKIVQVAYKYDTEGLLNRFKEIVSKEEFHRHRDRTIEIAKWCRMIMTGDDQAELVVTYKTGESTEQKKQRIRLYNSKTAYVSGKVVHQFKEVERAENVVDNIWYQNEADSGENKLSTLNTRLEDFHDQKSVKRYIHDAVRRLNFFDPNAWIVVEFERDDIREAPWPYPVEIYSDQVVNYEYSRGELEYLVVRFPIEIEVSSVDPAPKEAGKRKAWKYTMYGPDISYNLIELGEKDKVKVPDNEGVFIVELKNKDDVPFLFILEIFDEFNSKATPARRIGYIKDANTNWETYVSPLHSARHIYQDMINVKAEYDLHRALHGFLQKFSFAETCDFESLIDEGGMDFCEGGKLKNSGRQCPSCKGTGVKVHTTVQDVILVKMPSSQSDHIKLSEMVHYVEIPAHVQENLKEDLKDLERDVSQSIFNTNTFDRSEIAVTATEKRLDLQSMYNVLTEFGIQVSDVYKFCVMQSARFMDLDHDLVVQYQITRDFHLESLEELLDQLKKADTAPYAIKQAIEFSILAKQNQDDSTYIEQIRAQERFRPFKDKSIQEMLLILSGLPENHPSKLLWMYFDEVFESIWNDRKYALFHKWKYDQQKRIVDGILEKLAKRDAELLATATFRDALDDEEDDSDDDNDDDDPPVDE